MSIRRLQYQIDYTHILTFREDYKNAVYPFFGFENMEYAIENENTIHESIRLIYKNEQVAFFLRKEGVILLYEGDVTDIKNPNGMLRIFWDIYEKIKTIRNYTKTNRHFLILHAVKLDKKEIVDAFLSNNKYLHNPFGPLEEASCIYEFTKDGLSFKFEYGNYNDKDIKKQDLTPFKTKFNDDLVGSYGFIGRLEISEPDKNPTLNKFKSMLKKGEEILESFELIKK